jgi:hypothetical protein
MDLKRWAIQAQSLGEVATFGAHALHLQDAAQGIGVVLQEDYALHR